MHIYLADYTTLPERYEQRPSAKADLLSALPSIFKAHCVSDDSRIKGLIKEALTDKINDRDVFMKGIDYSYYYEEE